MKRELKINHKIWVAINKPQPVIVIIGGRGSGKSIGVGDVLTFEMDTKAYDIYCLREFQDSLSDSVHKVFKGSINDRMKLEGWDIQQNTVIAPNGASTTYKGANRNPDSVQSAQGYLRSWFEEAHRASQESIDKLLPTIIRNPGAKCIFTANPQSSGDPFSQRFIVPYQAELDKHGVYEDSLHYIVMINWRDNPWWNEEQEALRQWDYDNIDRAKYDWMWEGKFLDTVDNSIIKPEWFDACIDAHLNPDWKITGKKVVSHDPSDTGNDNKGLCYRHGSLVLDIQEKELGDISDGCDWATGYAINVGADEFIWDGDGMGIGLRRQISDNFTGKKIVQSIFKGSEGATNPDSMYDPIENSSAPSRTNKQTFKNKRSQMYTRLADRMYKTYRNIAHNEYNDVDDMISLSSNIEGMQALRSEVCRIPKKDNGNGLIQIMSKIDMAKLKIESPNMADSLMMSMAIEDKIISNDVHIPQTIRPVGQRNANRRH